MAVTLQTNVAQSLPQHAVAKADALPLRAGQVVEARVVSSGQGSNTQLAIGNTVVDAALQVKLQEGALVRLLVQGAAPNLRLTVLPNPPQTVGSQVQAQIVPQSTPQQSQSAQPQANAASQSSAQPVQPSPATQLQGQAKPVSAQGAIPASQSSTEPVQANTSSKVPAPTSANLVARPAVLPGQPSPVTPTPATTARPALVGGATASTGNAPQPPSAQPLTPGTILRVETRGVGANARPVLVPVLGGETSRDTTRPQALTQQNVPVVTPGLVQQAIVQTVQGSIFRQDSIAALLTTLAGLEGKLSQLPRPVAQAGAEILNTRLNLDGKPLDGSALKQALQRSGVLLENFLGKGASAPQGDIKSGLLRLAAALRAFVGNGANAKPISDNRPPPPTPGATPRAGPPSSAAPLPDLSPRETAARLLGQAEAALSRMRLTQLSSLPDATARSGHASGPASDLNMEIPLLLGGQLSIGQFQLLRDGKNGSTRERDGSWKMKFSINFIQTGEVGATVSLRSKKIGVMLWAEREDVANALDEMSGELEQMLVARGLEPSSIRVRQGDPPPTKREIGAFMDNWS